jgi:5-enolpyruvylshikimate-3-phosphate synthase
MSFFYKGPIPASKSLYNRALIVKSYFPMMDLIGDSTCDDVMHMKAGIQEISNRSHIDCGEGGTTFRFLAFRASRHVGVHLLQGTERLMARPQQEIIDVLAQLGVQAQVKKTGLYVVSHGWKKPKAPIKVSCAVSSQYASALALNAWLLDFDLEFELVGEKVSESYFQLTIQLLRDLGMRIQSSGNKYFIPAGQRLTYLTWGIEPDLSSAFTVATAGALLGGVQLERFPVKSDQPDFIFLEIFKKMHIEYTLDESGLKVDRAKFMRPMEWNLAQSPDLFPVLAVLCAHVNGTSKLFGAPHLVQKESNRIQKVADLFDLFGIKYEMLDDGMIVHGEATISGRAHSSEDKTIKTFDPDQDHRMVMAGTVLRLLGYPIKVIHPEAVNKSFPEFWDVMGVQP